MLNLRVQFAQPASTAPIMTQTHRACQSMCKLVTTRLRVHLHLPVRELAQMEPTARKMVPMKLALLVTDAMMMTVMLTPFPSSVLLEPSVPGHQRPRLQTVQLVATLSQELQSAQYVLLAITVQTQITQR